MESTLNGIIIGVVGSLLATWIAHLINVQRKRAIQIQIEELKNEEEFLDRISKGNVQLLRSCFVTLFMAFGLISLFLGIYIVLGTFEMPWIMKLMANIFCATVLIGVGYGLIDHAKSIKKLRNFSEEKKKIQDKREILEKKI